MGKDSCIISGDSITKLCERVSSMLITRVCRAKCEHPQQDALSWSRP